MRKILIALASLFLCSLVAAQTPLPTVVIFGPVKAATYTVEDSSNPERNRIELWTDQIVPDMAEDMGGRNFLRKAHQVRKEVFGKRDKCVTETHRRWQSEVRSENERTYVRQVLQKNPVALDSGEQSYGYFEERSTADDSVIESYPVFYRVKEDSDGLYTIVFQKFIPGLLPLEVLETERVYREGEYFLPLRESHTLKYDDKVVTKVVFTRTK